MKKLFKVIFSDFNRLGALTHRDFIMALNATEAKIEYSLENNVKVIFVKKVL